MSIIQDTLSALHIACTGANKAELLTKLTNNWELTDVEREELYVSSYYIKCWEGSYLRNRIHDGLIVEDNISYCVIYRSCTPANIFKAITVKLSFRASALGNFVLIQPSYRGRGI